MAQIQKGTTYVTGGSVTALNLNAHVDSAVLLPGAIVDQSTKAVPVGADAVLLNSAADAALRKTTLAEIAANIIPANATLAANATKLQTARNISLTGDVTGSASFDGSANASIAATLAAPITPTTVSDQANTSTGYFSFPIGNTAQRPVSPFAGILRWNSQRELLEIFLGGVWNKITFSAIDNVNLYIVAGGGGGGSASTNGGCGGAGGAGGLISSIVTIPNLLASYAITIGAGGAAGANGANSTAFGGTAIGGGAGANWGGSASVGGSGGGGYGGGGASGTGAAGTVGQGTAGGDGTWYGPSGQGAGGVGGGSAITTVGGVLMAVGGIPSFQQATPPAIGSSKGGGGNGGQAAFSVFSFPSFPPTAGLSGAAVAAYQGLPFRTGGTITTVNAITVHLFTSNGTFGS